MIVLLLKKFQGDEILLEVVGDLLEDFDDWNSLCDEYVCEVWCG